jgi:hypothetical protein
LAADRSAQTSIVRISQISVKPGWRRLVRKTLGRSGGSIWGLRDNFRRSFSLATDLQPLTHSGFGAGQSAQQTRRHLPCDTSVSRPGVSAQIRARPRRLSCEVARASGRLRRGSWIYCLTSNHVHLLLDAAERMESAV